MSAMSLLEQYLRYISQSYLRIAIIIAVSLLAFGTCRLIFDIATEHYPPWVIVSNISLLGTCITAVVLVCVVSTSLPVIANLAKRDIMSAKAETYEEMEETIKDLLGEEILEVDIEELRHEVLLSDKPLPY